MGYVKPHPIRDLKSKDAAQDIDANFDALWDAIRKLKASIEAVDEDTAPSVVGRDGVPGPPGEDGTDGEPGPPGTQGVNGAAGSQGPSGPATLGPMGQDGIDGDEGMAIPGPVGPTGATGSQGPAGPATLGPMSLEGEPGEDAWMIPGPQGPAGSSGGSWSHIATRTCTGNAQEDFTDLGSYTEILVVCQAIVKSVSGVTSVRVSTDNGSTFLSSSGDYHNMTTGGVATTTFLFIFTHTTNATAARTSSCLIKNFNGSTPKYAFTTAASSEWFIPSTTSFNAIRVLGNGGGNLNTGTIYIYGRT